jgi:flagellar basal-body rod protein FlgG
MFRGLYTAYTGMRSQQEKMDTISNNLANVDTAGYKKDQVVLASFREMLTLKINDPEIPYSKRIGKMSLGVKAEEIHTDHLQGSLRQTDESLNVALQGQGMIKVGRMNEDGTMTERYTRDGSFMLDQEGHLVTSDGLFVLGEENALLTLDQQDVRINSDGTIFSNEVRLGQIQIVGIEDTKTLRKEGGNLYLGTEGTVEIPFVGTMEQGFLESSNANSIEEMINMINVMRTYESNQRIIQTYDATMEKVVNNVGSI